MFLKVHTVVLGETFSKETHPNQSSVLHEGKDIKGFSWNISSFVMCRVQLPLPSILCLIHLLYSSVKSGCKSSFQLSEGTGQVTGYEVLAYCAHWGWIWEAEVLLEHFPLTCPERAPGRTVRATWPCSELAEVALLCCDTPCINYLFINGGINALFGLLVFFCAICWGVNHTSVFTCLATSNTLYLNVFYWLVEFNHFEKEILKQFCYTPIF